ncbi:hypothetical protein Hanom_Chr06g00544411 [Helianthus anomalus]
MYIYNKIKDSLYVQHSTPPSPCQKKHSQLSKKSAMCVPSMVHSKQDVFLFIF